MVKHELIKTEIAAFLKEKLIVMKIIGSRSKVYFMLSLLNGKVIYFFDAWMIQRKSIRYRCVPKKMEKGGQDMHETPLHYYRSKVRLFLQIIFFFSFMIGGSFIVYMGGTQQSLLVILLGLCIAVLFSFFWAGAILKLLRYLPYVTITNTYIQVNPQTKSEVTIYLDDIISIRVTESSFQKLLKISIHNTIAFFDGLSLCNKIRLGPHGFFGFEAFTVTYSAIRKRDREKLLAALDNVMEYKDEFVEGPTNMDINMESANSQQDILKKFGAEPLGALDIDKAYFKKAYGYSFIIFLCMFILFYLLLNGSNSYLFYIIFSFLAFPFAKVFIDWMGVHKLRQKIDKQKESAYYYDQIILLFEVLLFHVSIFIAPFGLFLLLRNNERKSK